MWDNRRIQCISAEENNNGYFRELKSFANIYFYFCFGAFFCFCLFLVCLFLVVAAFGCHLLTSSGEIVIVAKQFENWTQIYI